jgi:glycosyltransferase involved in cell wall biosynthesis
MMRPIRVALILYRDSLDFGGALRVLEILAHALDPKRVEVHIVFAYGGPGPVTKRANVPCHFLNCRGPFDFGRWVKARRMMKELNPDILHFHNPVYWLHAALLGEGYKKILHLHGPYFVKMMGSVQSWLLSQSRRLADVGVCITREVRQIVLDHGWSPQQTWTVFNAIDCTAAKSELSKRDARAALGLPEDCLVLGMVCRLAWYKGCQDAIRILARLNRKWHLVFCGDGPMRPYLENMAQQEGLADRTHFVGMLDETWTAYAAMDAFLFLSKLEPFGLVIGEAMAARVPVFGLGGEGAYRDALYPLATAENSVLVERTSPGDYVSPEPSVVLNELANRINDFGAHPESYQPMIDRAYQWVLDRFDGPVQAESMSEVYDFVMGRLADSPKYLSGLRRWGRKSGPNV